MTMPITAELMLFKKDSKIRWPSRRQHMDPVGLIYVLVTRVRYVGVGTDLPFKTNSHVSLVDEERSAVAVRILGYERRELNWEWREILMCVMKQTTFRVIAWGVWGLTFIVPCIANIFTDYNQLHPSQASSRKQYWSDKCLNLSLSLYRAFCSLFQ